MLSDIGRAAIRRVGAGVSHRSTNRVLQDVWHLQRAGKSNNTVSPSNLRQFSFSLRQSYPTTTPATKPKSKTSTTTKPKTKKAASKKPVKKAVRKKVVAKPKPKNKVLTELQKQKATLKKEREELKALKATALTSPKSKPATAWTVLFSEYMVENGKGPSNTSSIAKDASAKYKSLTTEELEKYNHIANQHKIENESAYKKWIDSHTPEQIRLANNARHSLNKKEGRKGNRKLSLLEDPRIPKRAPPVWAFFCKERWSSGDFKGITAPEGSKRIWEEWKELSPSQRKPYEDLRAATLLRYVQEYKTVFGRDPEFINRQRKAAA